jgi:hypothetical protein
VNPARSLGPALIVGGTALHQVWLFIVAPFVGAVVAAGLHLALYPQPEPDLEEILCGLSRPHLRRFAAVHLSADEGQAPARTALRSGRRGSPSPERQRPCRPRSGR